MKAKSLDVESMAAVAQYYREEAAHWKVVFADWRGCWH
jgi:hypothetical protein